MLFKKKNYLIVYNNNKRKIFDFLSAKMGFSYRQKCFMKKIKMDFLNVKIAFKTLVIKQWNTVQIFLFNWLIPRTVTFWEYLETQGFFYKLENFVVIEF